MCVCVCVCVRVRVRLCESKIVTWASQIIKVMAINPYT